MTYWVFDEQSKRLLARSVVRSYRANSRVRFDPALDTNASLHTAHSGGDTKLSSEIIEAKLKTAMDWYDEQEKEPIGYEIKMAMKGKRKNQVPNRQRPDHGPLWMPGVDKSLKDGNDNPFVDVDDHGDPYEGKSKLRYGRNPMEVNAEIPIFERTKMVTAKNNTTKGNYRPPKVDIYPHVASKKKTKPYLRGKGSLTSSKTSNKFKAKNEQNVRHVGNMTKWVPILGTAMITLLGTLMGTMLMPTHVTSMPTQGIRDIPIMHPNPTYLRPIEKNEGKEKLRAYHAMCDKWNDLMNPDPNTECWRIHKILKCSKKVVKDGRKSIFYKAQFDDGNKA